METTEVFNGYSPLIWTDLDLSNAVGNNYAMVTLRVSNLSSSSPFVSVFRQKGDVSNYQNGSDTDNMISIGASGVGQAIIYTDSTGMIQWKPKFENLIKIEVVAYTK